MAYSEENIIEKVNAALMNPATLYAEPWSEVIDGYIH